VLKKMILFLYIWTVQQCIWSKKTWKKKYYTKYY